VLAPGPPLKLLWLLPAWALGPARQNAKHYFQLC
jgi:hypothetical protein